VTVLASGRVGRDFRVTLPREVREALGLLEGDEIVFHTVEGMRGRVCMRRASGRSQRL